MQVKREQIGPTQHYKDHDITVHVMPIDVLLLVNGKDLGTYLSAEAARKGGMQYVDNKAAAEAKQDD